MIVLPKTHDEWIQERKKGLGASDAGTIIGVLGVYTIISTFFDIIPA